jgi:transposase
MKIAGEEIRGLVVRAYFSGTACRNKLSEIFGYTTVTIGNWIRAYACENRLVPRQRGHRISVFTQEEIQELTELLKK